MVIKGVIFDMDGVLCDSEAFICEAACRMFKEKYGHSVIPDDFIPFVGAGEDRYLGGVAEKYGIQLDMPQDKEQTYTLYLKTIPGRLAPLPGALDFVQQLANSSIQMAVATSADRIKMEGNLHEIGMPENWFKACVTGSDVKNKKPAPEIFLKAARLIELQPTECLVVEDAVNGVQAAKAAGCCCLGLTSSFNRDILLNAGADWTAKDLNELPKEIITCLGL